MSKEENIAAQLLLSSEKEGDTKQHRELFKDCALVEIIHLHDCLRGSLKALEHDVQQLAKAVHSGSEEQQRMLEKKVAGRFQVIWSVFRAHSSAEDEFIWPALQRKTQGRIQGHKHKGKDAIIEQEEYEEDHADEERMFSEMDRLLTRLRQYLLKPDLSQPNNNQHTEQVITAIAQHTSTLSQHLMHHLKKEETQCMPLVAQHLSKEEIHELVGQIMGKRSADTIAQIMTMAVQSLNEADRIEMVKYMKQAMSGTFFDRWLLMSGWMSHDAPNADIAPNARPEQPGNDELAVNEVQADEALNRNLKRRADAEEQDDTKRARIVPLEDEELEEANNSGGWTSPEELEKFIRAIATNPALTAAQKNSTIQGLRDSVWKSNKKHRGSRPAAPTVVNSTTTSFHHPRFPSAEPGRPALVTASSTRRVTPPSMYFKKNKAGKVVVISPNDLPASSSEPLPLFSASEMAPTYHDGAAASVLGCPHYARACKLRHPNSGRLYTCRLCCEQQRELASGDPDDPLDRYAVTEVLCMQCHALQPAGDRCINAECESRGKPFSKYFCRICHLYDDAANKHIFHCPYCNCCRLGKGLGIDFRHCMRCNACVSLADDDHQCIPQKLQGSCPICHESLFQSTEPLRGLKCGHVMHMSCFTEYRRGHSYTCPLCMRSMDDMKGKLSQSELDDLLRDAPHKSFVPVL
ncbi:hypothetical protein FisN_4Lh293 [Fistulifera solaris]|uniref:Zinc finger protein-like protein n=1 Tax=Fistulifera solaris TaxID=1519565 RepID=A0A1Z5KDL8_FISSO|nr:hypothetical protein FisN_4Lh293 [Fistulifera solaris]|eukprot:GAX24201.1 hypothetical protein FisN_4Lh293 [Fistulifera solaris]